MFLVGTWLEREITYHWKKTLSSGICFCLACTLIRETSPPPFTTTSEICSHSTNAATSSCLDEKVSEERSMSHLFASWPLSLIKAPWRLRSLILLRPAWSYLNARTKYENKTNCLRTWLTNSCKGHVHLLCCSRKSSVWHHSVVTRGLASRRALLPGHFPSCERHITFIGLTCDAFQSEGMFHDESDYLQRSPTLKGLTFDILYI